MLHNALFRKLACATCVLIRLALAGSFTGEPYIVTSLLSATHRGSIDSSDLSVQVTGDEYYHQAAFTVHNPDPLSNITTACNTEWPQGEAVPENVRCEDGTFAFSILDWVGVNEFVLDVKNTFKDPKVGDPPMDFVTLWGKEALNVGTELECVDGSQPGEVYCGLKQEALELPIYAAIA